MKTHYLSIALLLSLGIISCDEKKIKIDETSTKNTTTSSSGQSAVKDDISNPNIVQVAVSSADHSTLVTAVKSAGLIDALSNAGPFTVFAPVNAAFDALPSGTVESLLLEENKGKLEDILGYHTYVGVLNGVLLQDGLQYDMVYGGKVKISKRENSTYVNDAKITATIQTSNGVIHVIDKVLLPQ